MSKFAVLALIGTVSVAAIETPEYTVVEKRDGYEIREYAPHIVAQVTMTGEFDATMNGGFRKLADFIFGNNIAKGENGTSGSEKIEMTAPVLEQKVEQEPNATEASSNSDKADATRTVAFVMPRKYTAETLPEPKNKEVSIVQVPGKRYAAIQFSGWMNADKAMKRKEELVELLKRDKVETLGQPLLAQYNPPWTPGPMRKNEILIEVIAP
ncbi:MAG: heme-binding protein [Candidatus Hydrogenedentes bacterium]|nr:heme-binding protein [Candidatus Hydrogenedentota bacterium]